MPAQSAAAMLEVGPDLEVHSALSVGDFHRAIPSLSWTLREAELGLTLVYKSFGIFDINRCVNLERLTVYPSGVEPGL
jgi:hypothetical protein